MFVTSCRFNPRSTDPFPWAGSSHGGGANMLFADGHVEPGRQTNWLSPATRHRWNNDGQPHPETWGRE